jgi:glycolate dehydrogenase iron-sulfur subunit
MGLDPLSATFTPMQTSLADFIRDTPDGREADRILRACVHCGFCTATCPTYQLLGDELDGPRGRIYQIKQVLEGTPATAVLRGHLDRCLTCLSCESTCPSGVRYGRLLEIGRHQVEQLAPRPVAQRWGRRLLRALLSEPQRFTRLLRLAGLVRPLLPRPLRRRIPTAPAQRPATPGDHPRRMLLLGGCVQPGLAPQINAAAVRVLDRLGIALVQTPGTGCCGAVRLHLDDEAGAQNQARRNIDAWWPVLAAGAESLIATSSACALMLKDYGRLLGSDPHYADKARRVAELARDPVQVLAAEDLSALRPTGTAPVAFHAPCTLQHGQRLGGAVERLLGSLGMVLTPVAEPHLCCGSAGTYSVLQPRLSQQLQARKLAALEAGSPGTIATANIGCLLHLRQGARVPVVHWLELLDPAGPPPAADPS